MHRILVSALLLAGACHGQAHNPLHCGGAQDAGGAALAVTAAGTFVWSNAFGAGSSGPWVRHLDTAGNLVASVAVGAVIDVNEVTPWRLLALGDAAFAFGSHRTSLLHGAAVDDVVPAPCTSAEVMVEGDHVRVIGSDAAGDVACTYTLDAQGTPSQPLMLGPANRRVLARIGDGFLISTDSELVRYDATGQRTWSVPGQFYRVAVGPTFVYAVASLEAKVALQRFSAVDGSGITTLQTWSGYIYSPVGTIVEVRLLTADGDGALAEVDHDADHTLVRVDASGHVDSHALAVDEEDQSPIYFVHRAGDLVLYSNSAGLQAFALDGSKRWTTAAAYDSAVDATGNIHLALHVLRKSCEAELYATTVDASGRVLWSWSLDGQ
jgi:hypothetical protein